MSDATTTGQDVAKTSSAELAPYQKMVSNLNRRAELDASFGDAFELSAQAVNRIAEASTLDEVFDAAEKVGLQSMGREWPHLGDPVNILDIRFRKSDDKYRESGLGVFVIVDYSLDDGETFIVGTGSPNVVATLLRMESLGAFGNGKSLRIRVRSKDTQNGEMLYVTRP